MFLYVPELLQPLSGGQAAFKSRLLRKLAQKTVLTAVKSRQPNTVKKYCQAFRRWKEWVHSFAEFNHFPADPFHVAIYLTYLSEKSPSKGPIESAFYGLKWAHKVANFRDPTLHPTVKLIVEAVRRTHGRKRVPKEPMTSERLKFLTRSVKSQKLTPKGARFLCMATLAFAGFLRFSELASIRRSDISLSENYFTVSIHSCKNDVYRQGNIVTVVKGISVACPLRNLSNYLRLIGLFDKPKSQSFLFRQLNRVSSKIFTAKNVPMSYASARNDLHFFLLRAGLNPMIYGWHSFRSGGASTAAANNVPDRLFKRHGRWRSETAKDCYVKESSFHLEAVSRSLNL